MWSNGEINRRDSAIHLLNYWGLNIYFHLVIEPHEIPNNTQYIE